METLAYIHLAIVYENNADIQSAFSGKRTAALHFLQMAIALSILSVASSAMALQKGDRGAEVTDLQKSLQITGIYSGPVTGYYGQLTKAAVIQFQTANSLTPDGIAGPNTLSALSGSGAAPALPAEPNYVNRDTSTSALRRGSRGASVTRLQNALRALGYYKGPITGYYGQLTEKSVVKFQQSKSLMADGVVGETTITALAEE